MCVICTVCWAATPQHKIKKLLDYAHGGDVADPWYSRDFARAYQDIITGCRALLTALTTK